MTHLNQVWENYWDFAEERGWLVAELLRKFSPLAGKAVLDFGCGNGGAARYFSRMGSNVTAVDVKPELEPIFKDSNIQFINAKDGYSFLSDQKYDIVILQDVLEHVPHPAQLLNQAKHSLRPGGWLYISTPNRFSILNAISDPHWNLPGVALFPRKAVAFLVQEVFRRDPTQRNDLAALLSLKQLTAMLRGNNIEMIFVNTSVAKILFDKPAAVVCHPLHIRLVRWLRRKKLERWVYRIVNDRAGFFNRFINPTWYIVGRVA